MSCIVLSKIGPEKVKVIKIVREVTGLGLKEAKEAVDSVENGIPFEMDVYTGNEVDTLEKLAAIGAVAMRKETNRYTQNLNVENIESASLFSESQNSADSSFVKNEDRQVSKRERNSEGEFILFGQNISIPTSYIRNYKMDESSRVAAAKAKTEFYSWYKKRSGIEDVVKNYADAAVDMVGKYAFSPLFDSLGLFNIYDISDGTYVNKCVDCSPIDKAFEVVLSELEKIVDDENEMRQYRAARKAYRGRMVGGGFGLSGAIKGAVQAGAINATTGMAHSAVNAIGNMGSAIAASAQKVSLYNNSQMKDVLAAGICVSILNTYENHKQLINEHFNYFFEDGFDEDKAKALFENAMRFPEKREMLLVESVMNYPSENTLSYIFKHYEDERKNVYEIGEVFDLDFGKYIEEAFAALYTNEVKLSEQKVEAVKKEILLTMKEYGINSSDILNQINYDELSRIGQKYLSATEKESIQQILVDFNKYDAPYAQKKQVVREKDMWELASKYAVTYTIEETENILKRYYTAEAKQNEKEAQNAKQIIIEIMTILNVQTSATFDQLCYKKR